MILVDTSVWINHFQNQDMLLDDLLAWKQVLGHPFVAAEIAMGSLANREAILTSLDELPQAPEVMVSEVRHFIEKHQIFSKGIGFVDATLLVSAQLGKNVTLWSRDRRLYMLADRFGIAYQPLR